MKIRPTFKEYLKEAKYYRPVASGWDRESKQTDSRLSPAERGHVAAMGDISLDWNEETNEYNPYPLGSDEFEEYQNAFEEASEYIRNQFPDI